MRIVRRYVSLCFAGLLDGCNDDEFTRGQVAASMARWSTWWAAVVAAFGLVLWQLVAGVGAAYILFGFVLTDWVVFLLAMIHALRLAARLQARRSTLEDLLVAPVPRGSIRLLFHAGPMSAFLAATIFVTVVSALLSAPMDGHDHKDLLTYFFVMVPGLPLLVWFHGNSVALAYGLSLPVITDRGASAYRLGRGIVFAILICAGLTALGVGITVLMVTLAVRFGDSFMNNAGPLGVATGLLAMLLPGLLATGWIKGRLAVLAARRFEARLDTLAEGE